MKESQSPQHRTPETGRCVICDKATGKFLDGHDGTAWEWTDDLAHAWRFDFIEGGAVARKVQRVMQTNPQAKILTIKQARAEISAGLSQKLMTNAAREAPKQGTANEPLPLTAAQQAMEAKSDDEWKRRLLWSGCYTILVTQLGYWGRGASVQAAAHRCLDSSRRRTEPANIYMMLGDDTGEINSHGYFIGAPGSNNILIGQVPKLSGLLPKGGAS